MPREPEKNDVPDEKEYDAIPEGYYLGHIWGKGDAEMINKRPPKTGQFLMWLMRFRLTHNNKMENVGKPVVISTKFFQSQMTTIKTAIGGEPFQGKPVVIRVKHEHYEKAGDFELNADGSLKKDPGTQQPIQKTVQRTIPKVFRDNAAGEPYGDPEVRLNHGGKTLNFAEMDAMDLEEGRTPDAPSAGPYNKEDLPF